jgi:hypothetical protein
MILSSAAGACPGAVSAAVFDSRFFLAIDFRVRPRTCRVFALLRADLVLALPRFELLLRVAIRFFALAIAVSCEVCRRHANLEGNKL